jgi:hypothetical protein
MTPNAEECDYSLDELLKIHFKMIKLIEIRIMHPLHIKASDLIGNCII